MTGSAHAAFGVGGLTVAGGLFAYFKRGSVPSLVGSVILGGSLIVGGLLVNDGSNFSGHAIASAGSVGLLAIGASRYNTTRKPMPAAPMMVLGCVSAIYQIKKASDWYN